MKFSHKTESPEEFLVKLQNLALKAYPTPVDQPVAPVDGGVQGDQEIFDREMRENENTRDFAQMERKGHIISLFKKAMPNFIKFKLLETPETATIQELCTKARQKLIFRELCPVDDWSRDGFNEISTDNSEKFLTILTKKKQEVKILLKIELTLSLKELVSRNKAHRVKTQANILTTTKNGVIIEEDALTKIVETKDIIIITDPITSRINIKDDMEISLEETVEEETTMRKQL